MLLLGCGGLSDPDPVVRPVPPERVVVEGVPTELVIQPRRRAVPVEPDALDPATAASLNQALVRAGGAPLWGPPPPLLPVPVRDATRRMLETGSEEVRVVSVDGVALVPRLREDGQLRVELDLNDDGHWDERWETRSDGLRRQVRIDGVRHHFVWRDERWVWRAPR